jgi:hypothetical protein
VPNRPICRIGDPIAVERRLDVVRVDILHNRRPTPREIGEQKPVLNRVVAHIGDDEVVALKRIVRIKSGADDGDRVGEPLGAVRDDVPRGGDAPDAAILPVRDEDVSAQRPVQPVDLVEPRRGRGSAVAA